MISALRTEASAAPAWSPLALSWSIFRLSCRQALERRVGFGVRGHLEHDLTQLFDGATAVLELLLRHARQAHARGGAGVGTVGHLEPLLEHAHHLVPALALRIQLLQRV